MGIAERAAARPIESARVRAQEEVAALVDAGLAVMRRDGAAGLTVAAVLAEAGLSTRAFYRHFTSKDELLLAVYERESHAAQRRLQERIATAATPRRALEAWIDETLGLAFGRGRAARTRPLAREGLHLQADFPEEFAAIQSGVIRPLAEVLEAGRIDGSFPATDPDRDARSIHALAWSLVVEKLGGGGLTLEGARAHLLRFCLPALGVSA
jgi:AcrR family transcriptional regulator